ncbi:MAG: HypC/HybG/HupF family hydrogenase formation chaperone [Clostridiales bacterium]|nr:HypC/HybG/HupF family hydrogenase formation chaperone [Clostridiales bacterium]
MCVAVPGKVLSVENGRASIDFSGNVVTARSGIIDIVPGDYVLVHAGLVIQKLKESDAEDMKKLFEMLGEDDE